MLPVDSLLFEVFTYFYREEEAAKERRRVRFGAEGRSTGATQRLGPEVANVERQTPNSSPGGEIGTMLEPGSSPIPGGNLNKREMIVVRRPEVIIEDSSELDGLESLNTEAILGICPDMCPGLCLLKLHTASSIQSVEVLSRARTQILICQCNSSCQHDRLIKQLVRL